MNNKLNNTTSLFQYIFMLLQTSHFQFFPFYVVTKLWKLHCSCWGSCAAKRFFSKITLLGTSSFSYTTNQSTHQSECLTETNSGISSSTLLSFRAQTLSLLALPNACVPIMLPNELLGGEHTLWLSHVKSEFHILCGVREWTQCSLSFLPIALADIEAWSAWLTPFSQWFCKSFKKRWYEFLVVLSCNRVHLSVLLYFQFISFLTTSYIAESIKLLSNKCTKSSAG